MEAGGKGFAPTPHQRQHCALGTIGTWAEMEVELRVLTAISIDILDHGETLVSVDSPWTIALPSLPVDHDVTDHPPTGEYENKWH